jgi:ABC transporter substrate binding protein
MFALKPHCPSDLFLPWEVMPTQWSDDIMLHALAVLRFTTSSHPAPAGPLAKSGLRRKPCGVVSVIFAGGGAEPALAAKAATSKIPIVFANGVDPVEVGLVASLSRPGGNITGVSFLIDTLGPKELEALGMICDPRPLSLPRLSTLISQLPPRSRKT